MRRRSGLSTACIAGAVAAMLAAILVGVAPDPAAAFGSDDNFPGASISSVPYSDNDNSVSSTVESGETEPSCGPLQKTEWYQFTSPFTASMVASMTGNFPMVLAVYTDPNGTGPSGLNEVVCATTGTSSLSTGSFAVTAGETYYFQISANANPNGSFGGNFSFALDYDGPVPPPNDNFADAPSGSVSGGSFPVTGTNVVATVEPGEPTPSCAYNGDPLQNTAWWQVSVGSGGPLRISTEGSDFDTQMAIYTGTGLGDLVEVGCDDDNLQSLQSTRVIDAQNNTVYYVQVDGFGGGTGTIQLDAEFLSCQSVWHVDQNASGSFSGASWTNAFSELQDGLAAAAACENANTLDQVLVAAATYRPNEFGASRDTSFHLPPGVEVIGGYPAGGAAAPDPASNPTILSGDLGLDDEAGGSTAENSRSVVQADGRTGAGLTSGRTVLDGFIVERGNADGGVFNDIGGGIRALDVANLTVINSIIRDNAAASTGGGIFHNGAQLVLRDSVVTGNSGSVGGVELRDDARIISTEFSGNSGFVTDLSGPSLQAVDIINSTFDSTGDRTIEMQSGRLINSIIDTDGGIALSVQSGDAEVFNTAITGADTGIVVISDAVPAGFPPPTPTILQVTNTIIWDVNAALAGVSPVVLDVPDDVFTPPVVTIEHSILQGSGGSDSWNTNFGTDLGGNLDTDPAWIDAPNGNFRLANLSPAFDAGTNTGLPLDLLDIDEDGIGNTEPIPDLDETDRIKNGTVDMGPYEQTPTACQPTIHVDVGGAAFGDGLSWATAFADLQDGIAQADVCAGVASEIWIAEGTYLPDPSDRTVSFRLPDGVELVGGFVGTEAARGDRPAILPSVVLSGDLLGNDAGGPPGADNSQQVVFVDHGRAGLLTDLTVSGGNADGLGGGPTNGAGAYVEFAQGPLSAGALTLDNVFVTNNTAVGDGGGIWSGGPIEVTGGSLFGNSAGDGGAIAISGTNTSQFIDTVVSLNSATGFGGGLYVIGNVNLTTVGVDFSSNSANEGGAMYSGGGTLVVAGSAFKLNSATNDGGAIYANTDFSAINNSEFSGNRATQAGSLAGAIYNSSVATITSTTFQGNSAVVAGGAVLSDSQAGTSLSVRNSVFWDNEANVSPQIVIDGNGVGQVRSSNVQGSTGSGPGWDPDLGDDLGGNIDADPLFTNPNGFDFLPQPGSPIIDAGDAAFLSLDAFDRDDDGDTTDLTPDIVGQARIQGGGTEMGSREVSDGLPGFATLGSPCVVYDSSSAAGGLSGAIDGDEIRTVTVTGTVPAGQGGTTGSCIPSGATSATFLIVATNPLRGGNLRLSETGVAPKGGVVNFAANGLDNANTVTVPLPPSGQLDIAGNGGTFGVGLPLAGVRLVAIGHADPTPGDFYVPLTPCAVADSRFNQGGRNDYEGPFADNAPYPDIDVVGTFPTDQGGGNGDCGVPASATAVVVNVVAINPAGGTGRVLVSAVGTTATEGTPFAPLGMNNAAVAVVPLNAGGTINIDIEADPGATTHVRLVVLGYLSPLQATAFVPVNPCAAFDTRDNQGSTGTFTGLRQGGDTTTYQITGPLDAGQGGLNGGSCGVPTEATGVLLNLVAINPIGAGNLQVFATGTTPTGGVLNFASLSPTMNNANAVPVPLSADGEIDVFVNGGTFGNGIDLTHVRGVVLGYYTDYQPAL